MPCTRARTCASLLPAVWPTYSKRTGTCCTRVCINVTGADSTNYTWNTSATGTANITARTLTVGITTTGFDGSQIERTVATELLGPNETGASGYMDGIIGGNVANGNAEIAGIIDMNAERQRIRKEAAKGGMRTLRMDAWDKTIAGDTSVDEVLRVTKGEAL